MPAIARALVVGGGIGGLAAAIALRRSGIEVDLVEQQPISSAYGVGIIQPNNTLRALDRIGLATMCVDAGAPFPGWRICDAAGRLLFKAPAPTRAAPDFPPVNGISRATFHALLHEAADRAGVVVRMGVTVTEFDQDVCGVSSLLSDGSRARHDLLIACDGIHSDMRTQLFGRAHSPQPTGQGVWRYNLPRPADMEWGGIFFGASSKVGLVPLSATTMYMFLVTAEPDGASLRGDRLADQMRDRLAGYSGIVGDMADLIRDPAGVIYRPMLHVMLPSPWFSGRAVVIGDAAHATTPHLAQGAAMAIEDGVLLGELLAGEEPIDHILREFMSRRFARASYVVDTSSTLASWELEAWAGRPDHALDPGALLHEATERLMEAY